MYSQSYDKYQHRYDNLVQGAFNYLQYSEMTLHRNLACQISHATRNTVSIVLLHTLVRRGSPRGIAGSLTLQDGHEFLEKPSKNTQR